MTTSHFVSSYSRVEFYNSVNHLKRGLVMELLGAGGGEREGEWIWRGREWGEKWIEKRGEGGGDGGVAGEMEGREVRREEERGGD